MKIDTHQHFWKYDPVNYAWIDDQMEILKRDFLPNDLGPILKRNGFEGCVAVQADQSEEETSFLLELADQNDFIKGVVGWLDLRNPNIENRLEHFTHHPLLKGLRHVVQAEPYNFMDRIDFQSGIARLKAYDLTYDILVFPPHLPSAIRLVNKFPNQAFVVDHLAKPYIKDGKIEDWKRDMTELANASNVFCKISGMVTEADWKGWKQEDFKPYLDVVVDAFGVNRVMFGSDWPVCLLGGAYEQVLGIVEEYFNRFSKEERNKIFGDNAKHFYKL